MANVLFKRGLSTALPAKNAAQDGVFYLTTDTNRLYVGQGTTLTDLNKYVTVYASVAAMPTSAALDDFAYAISENVFAIYTDTGWKQINPDSYVNEIKATIGDTTDKATSITVSAKDNNHSTAVSGTANIKAGNNVHFSKQEDGSLVISSDNDTTNTTYDLTATSTETNVANINLKDNGDTADVVKVTGSGNVSVSVADNSNTITIDGKKTKIKSVSAAFDATGNFTVGASTDDDTAEKTVTVTPEIKYGKEGKQIAKFENGAATLSIYTKDEVDTKIRDEIKIADAMTFKGVITTTKDAEEKLVSGANAGDTYKLGIATNGGQIGDLAIAEGKDGNVTWTIIPSGDDQTVYGSVSDTSIAITDNSGADSTLAKLTIDADGDDDATRAKIIAVGNITGKTNVVTLKHGDAGTGTAVTYTAVSTGTTQEEKGTVEIPTVTGISKDANGHITEVTTATYKVVDTHNKIDSFGAATATVDNAATVTLSVKDADAAAAKTTTVGFTSDNLTVSNTDNTVKMNFEWGTF